MTRRLVVGLGNIVVDHLVVLPRFPQPDEKTDALAHHVQVGGPVPTGLVLLQRFGRRCALIGAWGDDAHGQIIEADLQQEGVDFSHSLRRAGQGSGFAHVWVDQQTGSRTIACRRASQPPAPGELPAALLEAADALYLDGDAGDAATEAARRVRRGGGLVFLDTGSLKPGMIELLRCVDVVSCPRRFLEQWRSSAAIEEGLVELRKLGPTAAICTDGQRGAWALTDAGLHHQRALPIERAVDTTGAGDVFCGALLHGLLEAWPIADALAFAAAAAAHKCQALGNRAALPTAAQAHAAAASQA